MNKQTILHIVWSLAILATLVIVGCGSSAAPSAPASPAASVQPKQASPSVSASASASASPSAANQAWKATWDETVAAAKKEGKVVIAGFTGDLYRKAFLTFQTAYPDIKVDFTGASGSEFAPKVLTEREGGHYLWDIHAGGATSMLTMLKPKGVFDPLRPTFILPEVLDDSKWVGGVDNEWTDKEGKYIFGFEGSLSFTAWVNRDMVPESELNTIEQLLDPKWKGKIGSGDPRTTGGANGAAGHLLAVHGEDFLRKLYSQDLVIQKDERLLAESIVRGRLPVVMGINPAALEQFRQEGLTKNIKAIAPDSPAGAVIATTLGNLSLINKAPHPNAAKVFINWLLSQAGQQAYSDSMNLNSRRLDVKGPPDTAPKPNIKYRDNSKEENGPIKAKAIEIAKEVIR